FKSFAQYHLATPNSRELNSCRTVMLSKRDALPTLSTLQESGLRKGSAAHLFLSRSHPYRETKARVPRARSWTEYWCCKQWHPPNNNFSAKQRWYRCHRKRRPRRGNGSGWFGRRGHSGSTRHRQWGECDWRRRYWGSRNWR